MASPNSLCALFRLVAVCASVMVILRPQPVNALQEHNDTNTEITSLALEGSSDHPEVDDESDYQFYGHIFVIEHILGHEDQHPKARWRRNYYVMSFDSTKQKQQHPNLENEIRNIKKVIEKSQTKQAQGNKVREMGGMQKEEEIKREEDEQDKINITETTSSRLFYPPTTANLLPDFTSVTLPVEALTRKPEDLKRLLEGQEDDPENDDSLVRAPHENVMRTSGMAKVKINEENKEVEGSSPSLREVLPPSEEHEETPVSRPSPVTQSPQQELEKEEESRPSTEKSPEVEEPLEIGDEVEAVTIPTVATPTSQPRLLQEEPKEEEPSSGEAPPSPEPKPVDSDVTSSLSDEVTAKELVTPPNPTWSHAPSEDKEEDHPNGEEQILQEVTTREGNRVRLVCQVKGATSPMVEWQRGANLTFPNGQVRVGGDEVHLTYARPEDEGTYMCTARQPHGAARTKGILLRVQYAPRVRVWARDMASGEGGVEMGCLVEGWPTPSVAWYANSSRLHLHQPTTNVDHRNGQLFDIVEWKMSDRFRRSVLTLNKVTSADFATYHCRAHNSQGVARGHIVLHDGSGYLNTSRIMASLKTVKMDEVEWQNSRLAAFLLSMVPPLYIALYIIAYLSCYKTSLTGSSSHGRFGTAGVTD